YRFFPWEDWREGKPALLAAIEAALARWAAETAGDPERRLREERLGLAFGLSGAAWNEELVLERYELLYEAGLVAEALRDLRLVRVRREVLLERPAPGLRLRAARRAAAG